MFGLFPYRLHLQFWLVASVALSGCASTRITDTSRSGTEQLLVSNAIDGSLDKINFNSLAGASVFVDDRNLECTDKKYLVGSVRQRVFQAGCRLAEKAEDADVVLELYSGAVGTDRSEGFVGLPALSIAGPVPIQLPEIKLFAQTSQYGTAKIGMVAYDMRSRRALSAGALSRARAADSSWSVFGIGPFSSGSINDELAMTRKLESTDQQISLNTGTPLGQGPQSGIPVSSPTNTGPLAGIRKALPPNSIFRPSGFKLPRIPPVGQEMRPGPAPPEETTQPAPPYQPTANFPP